MSVHASLQSVMSGDIWCSPMQDYQYVFKPTRCSRPRGESGTFYNPSVLRYPLPLPTSDLADVYIVYQLGSIFKNYVDLPDVRNQWLNAAGIIGFNNLMIDIYTSKGLSYPRFLVYCYMTDSNNILLAVKRDPKVDVFHEQDLYLRLYSNAYFRSDKKTAEDGMECRGGKVTTSTVAAQLQQQYNDMLMKKGNTLVWINGVLSHDVDQSKISIGDCVEFIWDSSIYRVIDFKVKDLATFHSTLDAKQKYVIHPSKSLSNPFIDYYDDMDIYVCNVQPNNLKGLYFYKHGEDAVRMLTHRDYSISTQAVEYITSDYDYWNNSSEATLRIFFRRSSNDRPLVIESSRIDNLYALDDAGIVDAMAGTNAFLTEWKAASLESSMYVKAMRSPTRDMPQSELQDLFGYHGIVNLVAKAFHDLDQTSSIAVGTAIKDRYTAYEYDRNGLFTGYYNGSGSGTYVGQKPDTRYVETIAGLGSRTVPDSVDVDSHTLSGPNAHYAVYLASVVNGIFQDEWVDITDSERIMREGDVIHILDRDPIYERVLFRDDGSHLAYTEVVTESDEIIEFTINTRHNMEGEVILSPSPMAYLETTVILNGYTLTEGMEYFLDWPRIVITDGAHRNDTGTDEVFIRAIGYMTSDPDDATYKEVGFTDFGYLSRNGIYNTVQGYSLKFVVDGRVYGQDGLNFGDVATTPVVSDYLDSRPYHIREYIQPMRGLLNHTPYELYHQARDLHDRIEDYLTPRLPEPVITPATNLMPTMRVLPSSHVTTDVEPSIIPLEEDTVRLVTNGDDPVTFVFDLTDRFDDMTLARFGLDLKGEGTIDIEVNGIVSQQTLSGGWIRRDYALTSPIVKIRLGRNVSHNIYYRGVMAYKADGARPYNYDGVRIYRDQFLTSSPMLTKIYSDLRSGWIDPSKVDSVKTDTNVIDLVKHAERLLSADPKKQNLPERFVDLRCFPIVEERPCREAEVRLLEKVSEIYFEGAYDPRTELSIVNGSFNVVGVTGLFRLFVERGKDVSTTPDRDRAMAIWVKSTTHTDLSGSLSRASIIDLDGAITHSTPTGNWLAVAYSYNATNHEWEVVETKVVDLTVGPMVEINALKAWIISLPQGTMLSLGSIGDIETGAESLGLTMRDHFGSKLDWTTVENGGRLTYIGVKGHGVIFEEIADRLSPRVTLRLDYYPSILI